MNLLVTNELSDSSKYYMLYMTVLFAKPVIWKGRIYLLFIILLSQDRAAGLLLGESKADVEM